MELTRSQVKKAGSKLKKEAPGSPAYQNAMDILAKWKAQHTKPLEKARAELHELSIKIDADVTLASREKRARSIVDKLARESSMALDTMQDIGGCRAVLSVEKDVMKLVTLLRKKKHIETADNYIKKPKRDGYRSFHLIAEYPVIGLGKLPIELQIRTKIQHAWATAGEITELFTNKSIKHLAGDAQWKEFYKDLSEIFAVIDSLAHRDMDFAEMDVRGVARSLKPNINREQMHVVRRLVKQQKQLDVLEKFQAYRNSLKFADESRANAEYESGYFLIHVTHLKSPRPEIILVHYPSEHLTHAQQKTYELEKRIAAVDTELVVLVSSQAVGGIKAAYPNYFADSMLFTKLLNVVLIL